MKTWGVKMPRASKWCLASGLRRFFRHLVRPGCAVFVVPFLAVSLTGCQTASRPAGSADWDKYVADYLEAYFTVHPDLAVVEARHAFAANLPDFTKTPSHNEIPTF